MKYLMMMLLAGVYSFAGITLKLDTNYGGVPYTFSKKSFNENGDLNVGYFVTCRAEHNSLCQNYCGADSCLVNSDSCEGCVTSRNLNVFALFNDFSKLFTLAPNNLDWTEVFSRIKKSELRLIDENAILNLFEDTQSDEKYENARARFLSSCPTETQKAFLLVDSELNPVLYICKGVYGQITYQTKWNAEIAQ
tara:strand:+ start:6453 stop:7031 length:579 start_codon:yes stop_codon:yes gene_type:complete